MGEKVDISVPAISYCIGEKEHFIIESTNFIQYSEISSKDKK